VNAAPAERIVWLARRALVGLRWPGLLGLSMLAVAAVVVFGLGRPMLERLAALDEEARALSARSGAVAKNAQTQTPAGQLASFFAFFPPPSALPDLLSHVQRAARDNGIALARGEYRLVREPAFTLARYQITYPVQGSYAQVRGFVNDVLDALPAAALEEMTLKRESVDAPMVEARVRFSLYLGAQP